MKPELAQWLLKKGATPTEVKIYLIAAKVLRGENIAFQNGDIARHYKTSRQNIRQYMARMVDKGIVKRAGFRAYVLGRTF